MGYIQELRQLVGRRPIIMVGATVLVINQYDELLMMRRTDNGCWGVPSGALEPVYEDGPSASAVVSHPGRVHLTPDQETLTQLETETLKPVICVRGRTRARQEVNLRPGW